MTKPKWDIRNEGRAWRGEEDWERFQLTPEKIEMVHAGSCGPTRTAS